jgi:peptidoglycan/xylan/chitin deacetylase (PgdA/CDA1 family)
MYHRIANETFDPWRLVVTPEAFAEQLAWLARHRVVLRLADFAALHRKNKLPRSAIALTFDDGYSCTAEVAVPMLNKIGMSATIFIAPEQIKQDVPFWWDDLQQIVIEHSAPSLTLAGEPIEIGERDARDWNLDSNREAWTPRQQAFYQLWLRLRTLPPRSLEAAMSELREQKAGKSRRESRLLMTKAQVRSIASKKIEFGSHALTHASLPHLSSDERAREILESAGACEALTGTRPTTFAYPYGDFDDQCEALVREAGYECACTIEESAVRTSSRLFALPRIQVGDWSGRELAKVLHAA